MSFFLAADTPAPLAPSAEVVPPLAAGAPMPSSSPPDAGWSSSGSPRRSVLATAAPQPQHAMSPPSGGMSPRRSGAPSGITAVWNRRVARSIDALVERELRLTRLDDVEEEDAAGLTQAQRRVNGLIASLDEVLNQVNAENIPHSIPLSDGEQKIDIVEVRCVHLHSPGRADFDERLLNRRLLSRRV